MSGRGRGRGGGPQSRGSGRGGGPQGHGSGRGGGHSQTPKHGGGQGHNAGRGGSRGGAHSHSSSRGGHGSGGGNRDVEDLKRNLQDTIRNAEKTLQGLSKEKGGKQTKSANKNYQDSRGSRSMTNVSASSHSMHSSSGRGSGSHGHQRGGITYRGGFPKHPGFMNVSPMPPGCSHLQGQFPHNPVPVPNRNNTSFNPYHQQGPSAPPLNHDNFPHQPTYSLGNAPPPSYDEAIQDDKAFNQKGSKSSLTAETLVKTLVLFNGQFGNAETIGRQVEIDPVMIINFAKSRRDLFSMMGEGNDTVIELVPKIALCSDHFSSAGCTEWKLCDKLHICRTYVTEFCKVSPCQYGHRWDTTHNKNILSKFYLDIINPKILHQVIKKVCKDNSKLRICNYYNSEKGCKYDQNCWKLHICRTYVMDSGKCSNKGCALNHDITSQRCIKLLRCFGVQTNESPRDILMHVSSSLGKEMQRDNMPSSINESKHKDEIEKKINSEKWQNEENASNDSTTDEYDDSDASCDSKVTDPQSLSEKKKKKKNCRPKSKCRTVKSTDVLGDVEIPQICLYGVDDKCKNFTKGCRYLHSKSLFHWQTEKNGKWYNLRIFQSKILETAYRDVSKRHVEVPALEQTKLEDYAKELLNVLGTSSWNADFKSMVMSFSDVQLKIRRVSTQSSVLSDSPKATVFEWYFEDEQGKWIQYGQVNSLGKQELICNISSEDIEKQYLCDTSSSMLICNTHFKYKLDFATMTQTNEDTKTVREIRRRPSRLSYQKKMSKSSADDDPSSAVPAHWSPMMTNQTHVLVPLETNSNEYEEVSGRLRLTVPTANVVKIERLQNPYLWRLFQYRKLFLSQRYDGQQLNMQKLFHGTDPQNIDTICKENFDWRQGISVEQSYGQGTYFSHSAAIARDHCTPNDFGRRVMFLAHVIIGMVAKGDKSLTRPPSNPATDALYDTTVDDINAPTVFVKYDKDEYYPEYIIEFY